MQHNNFTSQQQKTLEGLYKHIFENQGEMKELLKKIKDLDS